MQYSIIINCYNTLPLLKKCITRVLETTGPETEILLINNHPPYPEVQNYLRGLNHSRVRVLDPGKNIGCNHGFTFGAVRAKGKYLVKLDDDIVPPKNNWTKTMYQALCDFPNLAYVGLPPSDRKIGKGNLVRVKKAGYEIEFANFVLFCCVMINRKLWAKHFVLPQRLGLYGYDDVYCAKIANKLRLKKAYLISHVCRHLRHSSEADRFYQTWKRLYAHGPKIRIDFDTWKKQKI